MIGDLFHNIIYFQYMLKQAILVKIFEGISGIGRGDF
jgi:hypothetical protein